MGVTAHLHDGGRIRLAARLGDTPEQIVEKLTADSLTGSAVPLDDVEVETAAGGTVRFGAIARLEVST